MFITFEGIEGCGKSTQARRLVRRLRALDVPCVATFEPGGTEIGKRVRKILLDRRSSEMFALTELLLYEADRAQHVREVIKPAVEKGKWVICDRYFDATTAYQGFARGQNRELVRLLNLEASQGVRPDLTFLLDCPVEIGLQRAISRNEAQPDGQDRFEREVRVFHQAVREGYLAVAKEEEGRFRILDASQAADLVESAVAEAVRPFLEPAA